MSNINYQKEKETFNENGYLIIKDFFEIEEFDNIKKDIIEETNSLIHKLYNKGIISTDYSIDDKLTVDEKLIKSESEYIGTSILLHTEFASKLKKSFGETLFSNLKLLNLISNLLSSTEISGHPEWNLRCKTPNNKYFNVPWHQDSAYLEPGSEFFNQITCWITLVNITDENGPLQIIKEPISNQSLLKHKLQKNLDKSFNDSWYLEIEEKEIQNNHDYHNKIITCSPLTPGSIVLFTNNTIHRSLPNFLKDSIRWTIDIRFLKSNDPTGFNPIDTTKENNENKMKLKSSTQSIIPIDYSIWSPESNSILMTTNTINQKEENKLLNYSIEGPWFNRWK